MAKINNNQETAKEKGEKYLRITIWGILSHSLLSVRHGVVFFCISVQTRWTYFIIFADEKPTLNPS